MTKMRVTWKLEIPYPDGHHEYSMDIGGYNCFVAQYEKSNFKGEWGWVVSVNKPDGYGWSEELTVGEGDENTRARAMSAAVRSVKRITRRNLRELVKLHAAKTVDMKISKRS